MRNISFLLLLLFAGFNLNAQQTKFSNAIEYNDYIVNKQTEIGGLINGLMDVVNDTLSTAENAHTKRTSAIIKMNFIIDDVRNMPDWNGNTQLRDAAVELFKFYRSCFENEYKSMIDIIYKVDATDADYAEMDKLLAQVTEKEKPMDAKFEAAQVAFADANGFKLTPPGE